MMSNILELEKELRSVEEPHQRVDLLNQLALALRFSDFSRAVALGNEAYALSHSPDTGDSVYPKGEADSLINLGWFNADSGEYELALEQAETALRIFCDIGYHLGEARALGLLGRTQMYLGNYPAAFENHLKQLDVAEKNDDLLGQASALNSLGALYTRLENYSEAIKHFQKSLSLCLSLGDEDRAAITLNNCAISYYKANQYSEALEHAYEGLAIGQKRNNTYVLMWSNFCLGEAYSELDSYDEALSHYLKALELMEEEDNSSLRVDVLISLGRLYNVQQQPATSISYLNEALELAEASNTKPSLYRCHEGMATAYRLLGDFEKALNHFQQFHELKELVINLESEQRLAYMDAQHRAKMAEQEAEIYQLRAVELKQEITVRENAEAALLLAKEEAIEAQLRAESANRAKSTFLSNMSHELRTPLNAILGFGQLLEMDETLSDEQAESVTTILASGNHLLALISEILDLSKIEAGKLDLQMEPCSISHVTDSVLNLVQMQALAKELRLEIDISAIEPELLIMDETRLAQILVNLLHNAIKFTAEGEISLVVTPLTQQHEMPISDRDSLRRKFRFEVKDSGVGMSEDELEMIFRPFEQVGHVTSRSQGTGLGLAITQRLVELMGGTLQVSSTVGAGSVFFFELEFDVLA